MSNNWDFKKIRSISKIRKVLNEEELVEFKIGKTDNLSRREEEYKIKGYPNLYSIEECYNLEEINQLEKDLIAIFKNNPKCANINDGGGGNISDSEKYYIYMVTK